MISVIVPVWNVEMYLRECLDSLAGQTYTEFEVIVVDDGSTDGSEGIARGYAERDGRFCYYRKENGGVSAARNYGLERARGEYICFVDADDVVEPEFLGEHLAALVEGVDSTMCGYDTFRDLSSGERGRVVVPDCRKVDDREENFWAFYDYRGDNWQPNVWNRLFRASVIKASGLRFREDIYYKEDGLFVGQYLCASNGRVGCIDRVLYHYRCNPKGALGRVTKGYDVKLMSGLLAHRQLVRELKQAGVSHALIRTAKEQAKTVSNWNVLLMHQSGCHNPWLLLKEEIMICKILGLGDYLSWRGSQLTKRWKR